jgi:2-methylcitrate dehydratase PrpD
MQASASPLSADSSEARRIATFALGLQLSDIPAAVRETAKEHFLDAFGTAIAASGFDFGRVTLEGVRGLGSADEATAIGSGVRLPAPSAALVNGVLAHGLDFDDTHITGVYHASAHALAASLAAGEAQGADGGEVLAAFIAAIEVGCRLSIPVAPELLRRSYHPTGVCGTFAAALAAGRLQGVDHGTLVNALGLCGSQASGILEVGTSWLKRLHPGWSAHSAVVAVALARAGFQGPPTVFEGPRGFYVTHTGSVPEQSPTMALGGHWETSAIALKPYPCCHLLHAFVDAALELRGQFDPADIERIDCPLTADMHPSVARPREDCIRPANPYRALFSVAYVVALGLVRGRVDLAAFYDEPLDAPEVLSVAAKVWCTEDPLSDYPAHFPGEVVVHLKDGRVLRSRKCASLGTPDVPLAREAIIAKFMANATREIRKEAASEIVERVLALEGEASLAPILALTVS